MQSTQPLMLFRPWALTLLAGLSAFSWAARTHADWPIETQTVNCGGNLPIASFDGDSDRAIRRTDAGGSTALDLATHRAPELIGLRISNWAPQHPPHSLYSGCWGNGGPFVRVEVAFAGLLNPPGRVGLSTPAYAPFEYGPHPVSGFIEFDIDDNVNTGGDVGNPENMYPGNIARFGGLPTNSALFDRIATLGENIGGFVGDVPLVERSGEDFHIALFGDLIDETTEIEGDGDGTFEWGETWTIRGSMLHRAHGYAIFSSANGNGEYEPVIELEFRHDAAADVTLVSLVYPLTNAAAASMGNGAVQPPDSSSANDNSILEGLLDLKSSALAAGPALQQDPAYPLIEPWGVQAPSQFLNASNWRVTCHFGMSYPAQDLFGAFVAWTDIFPNAALGDFNGDGIVTTADVAAFDAFVAESDGDFSVDADGVVNGRVRLFNFGPNFSLFDINYNGVVDDVDRSAIPVDGDINDDLVVDLADAEAFAALLLNPQQSQSACNFSTPSGACCVDSAFGPDICFDSSNTECQAQAGHFQGAGTSCVTDGCVLPSGACCVRGFGTPSAFCFEATLSECTQILGIFHGFGTSCSDANLACETIPNEGACCMNTPSIPCRRVTQAECAAAGGLFQGVGTLCSDPQIPCTIPMESVPCCHPINGCVLMEPLLCSNQGGLPFIGATSCGEVECPGPNESGACCVAGGGALTCLDTSASACFQFGGSFLGDGTSCANTQCGDTTLRACCLPPAGCQALTVFDCVISGGTPATLGTDCANANCGFSSQTTGACCIQLPGLAAERCVTVAGTDCAQQGGSFSGIGSDCDGPTIPCPSGPLVILTPSAFVDVLLGRILEPEAIAAADIDGDGVADGRDIHPYIALLLGGNTASTGACCVTGFGAQNVCIVASESECDLTGGTFSGIGTFCDGPNCPTIDAINMGCCLPGGCTDMPPAACGASGGTSDPDALLCEQRARRSLLQQGDVNHDGRVNGRDIHAFIERLLED